MANNAEIAITQIDQSEQQAATGAQNRSDAQTALRILNDAAGGQTSPAGTAADRPAAAGVNGERPVAAGVSADRSVAAGVAGDRPAAAGAAAEQPNCGDQVGERVKKLESSDRSKEALKKEVPLTAFERSLVNGLSAAVDSGNLSDVRAMLNGLGRLSPETSKRVLNAFARQLEGQDRSGLTHVTWETGTNNRGESFTRLHVARNNDWSKSSGQTHVMVGSDGINSASHTKMWNSPPSSVDAGIALQNISSAIAQSQRFGERDGRRMPTEDETRRVIEDWRNRLHPGEK